MSPANLTGPRKAAILLLALGEDAAAEVLKNLDQEEVQAITRHMNNFDDISPEDVERVMNEYFTRNDNGREGSRRLASGRLNFSAPETKSRYLETVLTRSLGAERAQSIVQGIISQPHATVMEKLKWHAPRTIAGFISKEHPQVIAVILVTLEEDGLADKVLRELPHSLQSDVVERIAGLKVISQEWINDIEETLADSLLPAARDVLGRDTGAHRVAEVLVTGPLALERTVMRHIEEKDPELAERIRDQMLRFEDFLGFDNMSLQKILHHATMHDLVLALRVVDEALLEHVLNNLSENTAETVLDELENMGPTRVSTVEEAQLRLVGIARDLIEKSEIVLLGKGQAVVA